MPKEINAQLFKQLNKEQFVGNKQAPSYGSNGLAYNDIERMQKKLGFNLPPDFCFLLGNLKDPDEVLFPWASFDIQKYRDTIEWVISGIEFDIEHSDLWLPKWGERPQSLDTAKEIMRSDFKTWPKLLPIYGHRFLVAEPCLPGNPVFSIYQTDVICYGTNLAEYLLNEFVRQSEASEDWTPNRKIPIWHDFAFSSESSLNQ
ncbi:MAG: hypothetical protein ACSHXY_05045 [Alphaproteobacteria bacterium]